MIHRFFVDNFKSLANVEVELEPVTVLVGRSGTGKTNFVNALQFLRDCLYFGSGNPNHRLGKTQQLVSASRPKDLVRMEIDFDIQGVEGLFQYQLSLDRSLKTTWVRRESLVLGDQILFQQESGKWAHEPKLVDVPSPGPLAIGKIPSAETDAHVRGAGKWDLSGRSRTVGP